MINILRHNVSENIDVYMKNPSNLRFLTFLAADLVPLLTALAADLVPLLTTLAAEVGHRGGGAVALKAQLDVAGVVVLTIGGPGLAAHTKGAQATAVRHDELHLAEGTKRRSHSLTHVLQHGSASGTQVTKNAIASTEGVAPGGGGQSVGHTVRVQGGSVDLCNQRAHVDVVADVVVVNLGRTIEQGGHLYIPELEKNSQSTYRFPSVFISCGREDG